MNIVTTPDPRLRQKCRKVNKITDEALEIIAEMRKASLEWEKSHPYELSAAMAAPQLGFDRRIIIVRDDLDDKKNKTFTALIDPEIIKTEGKVVSDFEGCLSVPDVWGVTRRPERVKVKALNRKGEEYTVEGEGLNARCLCHEIDHLDGHLFTDNVLHSLTPEEVEEMMGE